LQQVENDANLVNMTTWYNLIPQGHQQQYGTSLISWQTFSRACNRCGY